MGVTGTNSTSSFSIQFSSILGSTPNISRLATFDSTLADINDSQQLELIAPSGLATALSSQIIAASAAAAGGDKKTAVNILGAFKSLVIAQTSVHLKQPAVQALLEDANSLIHQNR
jgi:hypothetical protein